MDFREFTLSIQDQIATICFDSSGSVNKINQAFREDFEGIIEQLFEQRQELKGIILTSNRPEFVVGADLDEIKSIAERDQTHLRNEVERLNNSLRKLECMGVPVVAVITGSALGGGYEICLACHYRVALHDDSIKIGLPEAQLSLMPGAGGTVRLPKLIGLESALPILMEGKVLRISDALAQGLIDKVATDVSQLQQLALEHIRSSDGIQRWDRKGYRSPGASPTSPQSLMKLAIAPSVLRNKTQGRYPAPEAILASAVESVNTGLDVALQVEAQKFCELLNHPVSVSMVNTFWQQLNEIKKGKERPNIATKFSVSKIGIIGAGMMGAGIAYVAANAGIQTVLVDKDQAKADQGKAYSQKILDKKLQKQFISEQQKQSCLARITATDNMLLLDKCEIIIEAVFENVALKKDINQLAYPHLLNNGVFASNTSSLPISDLATSVPDAGKFIGLHFFSPVDKMPLVEIIKGHQTSAETLVKAFDFVQQIGKTPIVVNDSRGFFTSRVFGTYVTESMALLQEGVPAIMIENAAKYAAMPVSPLAVTDEVSISLAKHIREEARLAAEAVNQPFDEHPADQVIHAMLDTFDRPGKAAGKGFYEYANDGKKQLWSGLSFFEREHSLTIDDIQCRLLFIQSIEAVRCLEEGVITSVGDANIGSIMGIGFAPWTGGALEYINQYGVNAFYRKACEFANKYGDRYTPPKLLQTYADEARSFC